MQIFSARSRQFIASYAFWVRAHKVHSHNSHFERLLTCTRSRNTLKMSNLIVEIDWEMRLGKKRSPKNCVNNVAERLITGQTHGGHGKLFHSVKVLTLHLNDTEDKEGSRPSWWLMTPNDWICGMRKMYSDHHQLELCNWGELSSMEANTMCTEERKKIFSLAIGKNKLIKM